MAVVVVKAPAGLDAVGGLQNGGRGGRGGQESVGRFPSLEGLGVGQRPSCDLTHPRPLRGGEFFLRSREPWADSHLI